MKFLEVESLSNFGDLNERYSLAIFGSGFESRSTHVLKTYGHGNYDHIVVLGFSTNHNTLSREENDAYFGTLPAVKFVEMDGVDDDRLLYSLLDELVHNRIGIVRILVDYSVMTRSWYAAILTWARLLDADFSLEIDFVYSSGRYLGEFEPLLIEELTSLPNFEGISGGFRKTTALFGLGYDNYATLAIYDRIEPDVLYCCIAGTRGDDPSTLKVLNENQVIVDAASRVIRLPLLDVASSFRYLCNLVLSVERDSHIVVVPMGPKTHVLVTLLVALRMPWITCLHAKGSRPNPVQAEALGPISIGRISFEGTGDTARSNV